MKTEDEELCKILRSLEPSLKKTAIDTFRINPERFELAIDALEKVIDLRKKICD